MTFGFGEVLGFGGADCVVCGLDVATAFGFAAVESLALVTTFSLTLLLTLLPAGVCSVVDGASFGLGVTTAAGVVATAALGVGATTSPTRTGDFTGFFTTRFRAATGV